MKIRDNAQNLAKIENLSEYDVSSLAETMVLLVKGDEERKFAETRLNQQSSRSHTVFKINIVINERNVENGRNLIKTSQINLVDLAGSEAVNKT